MDENKNEESHNPEEKVINKENINNEANTKDNSTKVENKTIEIYEDKNDIKQEENPTAKSFVLLIPFVFYF